MAAFFLMSTFPSFGSEMATPFDAGIPAAEEHIHELVEEVVEPTCLLSGSRIVTCRLCTDYREEVILPMLGHSDQDGDFLCDRCGTLLELFQRGEK